MNKFVTLALVGALCLTPVFAQAKKPKTAPIVAAPTFGNVAEISAAQLKAYLTFIASDEMEGRDTPSKGLDITARKGKFKGNIIGVGAFGWRVDARCRRPSRACHPALDVAQRKIVGAAPMWNLERDLRRQFRLSHG